MSLSQVDETLKAMFADSVDDINTAPKTPSPSIVTVPFKMEPSVAVKVTPASIGRPSFAPAPQKQMSSFAPPAGGQSFPPAPQKQVASPFAPTQVFAPQKQMSSFAPTQVFAPQKQMSSFAPTQVFAPSNSFVGQSQTTSPSSAQGGFQTQVSQFSLPRSSPTEKVPCCYVNTKNVSCSRFACGEPAVFCAAHCHTVTAKAYFEQRGIPNPRGEVKKKVSIKKTTPNTTVGFVRQVGQPIVQYNNNPLSFQQQNARSVSFPPVAQDNGVQQNVRSGGFNPIPALQYNNTNLSTLSQQNARSSGFSPSTQPQQFGQFTHQPDAIRAMPSAYQQQFVPQPPPHSGIEFFDSEEPGIPQIDAMKIDAELGLNKTLESGIVFDKDLNSCYKMISDDSKRVCDLSDDDRAIATGLGLNVDHPMSSTRGYEIRSVNGYLTEIVPQV